MEKFLKRIIPMRLLYALFRIYLFLDRRERSAATAYVFYGDELLLVRHSYGNPNWLPVGGFINKQEKPEEGLRREVKEEVGLDLEIIEPLGAALDVKRNIVIHRFYARAKARECIIDELEIKEARWFSERETSDFEIASDAYLKRAINYHKQYVGH